MGKRDVLFYALFSLTTTALSAAPQAKLPSWATEMFSRDFETQYTQIKDLEPVTLEGDFDGDKQMDIAIRIKEKSSDKIGIVVLLQVKRGVLVGAGKSMGNGGDDFEWMDKWSVQKKGSVSQGSSEDDPPTLQADALLVEAIDSASALIFWDGEDFQWYQQGD